MQPTGDPQDCAGGRALAGSVNLTEGQGDARSCRGVVCPLGQRQRGGQVQRPSFCVAQHEGLAVLVEQLERLPADGLLVWVRLGSHRASRGLTGGQDGRRAAVVAARGRGDGEQLQAKHRQPSIADLQRTPRA